MNFYQQPHGLVFLLFCSFHSVIVQSRQDGLSYFFYQHPDYPRDCQEAVGQCSQNFTGVYKIKPDGYPQPFDVYCDNQHTSGGWTVIHRRIDGSLIFQRNWEDYSKGFGFLFGEFWIGNDRLSYLTNQAVYELLIDIVLSNGSHFYVKYNSFRISDNWSQYALVNADEPISNSSCVVSTCPPETSHVVCECHKLCKDHEGMTVCHQNCVETCVSNGCFANDTNSITSNGDSYVNSDCSHQCTCNVDQFMCSDYQCSPNAECIVQEGTGQCNCIDGYTGEGHTCTPLYTDCYDVFQAGQTQDGVYSILPSGWTGSPFNVPCNMTIDEGGWTVLQRRKDGLENFERTWNEYKNGFGIPGQDFWLGNDKIYFITNQRDYQVRMDVVNLNGGAYFAKYDLFRITEESSNYRLEGLGVYDPLSTTEYDAMGHHRNQSFSTRDRDNDPYNSLHCARSNGGGSWYGTDIGSCDLCDFNRPDLGTNGKCPFWYNLAENTGIICLMYTDIKIRPV